MEALRTDLPILETIGSYRLLKHLGANDSVQVYLAIKEGTHRPSREVVLKIVSGVADEDAKKIEELRREAAAISKLNHPAIIRTHEFFEHGNSLVFIVENVEGVSLAELAAGVPSGARALTDDSVLYAGMSICEALAHAHGACVREGRHGPVVHKGLSPSKARVAHDGTVKLGGFGLTKPFGVSLKRKGRLEWESAYLAPEQVLGQPLSPKVDVYAAGLILWELLSGRSAAIVVPKDPFEVPTAMRALAERTLEPLVKLRPDLPRAVSAAVDAALVASPEKRTIGCAELAQEIRKHGRANRGKEELRAKVRSGQDPEPAVVARRPPPLPTPSPSKASSSESAPPTVPKMAVAAPASEPIQASPIVAVDSPPHPAPTRRPPPPPKFVPAPQADHRPTDRPMNAVAVPQPVPVTLPVDDSITSSTMEIPAPTAPLPLAPDPVVAAIPEPSIGTRATFGGVGSTAASALASALRRLRAPSGWSRNARIATYVGAPLAMTALIVAIAVGRRGRAVHQAEEHALVSPHEAAPTAAAALAETRPTALATPDPQPIQPAKPSVPAPSAPEPKEPEPKESVARSAPEPKAPAPPAKVAAKAPVHASTGNEFSPALKKKHLGHLTVHSSARYAKVYMMFTKFGRVEEPLTVPCGKRFIAIGLPPRPGRTEPVWLAPGQSTFIPCGGSLTVTMNPRRVR